jgi:hypothetical protein
MVRSARGVALNSRAGWLGLTPRRTNERKSVSMWGVAQRNDFLDVHIQSHLLTHIIGLQWVFALIQKRAGWVSPKTHKRGESPEPACGGGVA